MFKKIFSLLLVIMLIPCVNVLAADDGGADNNYTLEYADEIIRCLYPDIIINDEGSYTRQEFLSALTGLMNYNNVSEGMDLIFKDVSKDSAFYNVLSFGVSLGLVSEADYFYPENKITKTEALTMALRALGYEDYAKTHGGYPTGYLRAANEIHLTDGITTDNSSGLSYNEGLTLLYNLINTDILESKILSGENIEYIKTEGKTFIYAYHKIRVAEGVAEANEFSGKFSKDEYCREGYVRVDNELYKGSCSNLLGYRVRIYYHDDNAKTIFYAHKFENTQLVLKLSDGVELSDGYFYYYGENGNKKRASLERGYALIYNGKAMSRSRFSSVTADDRLWTFVDNNDDGTYDVVIVNDTRYMVASRVDTAEEVIYDYNKVQSVLKLDECSYKVYTSDGTEAQIQAIEPSFPIGYTISDDKKLCVINIFDKYIAGVITATADNDKIYIDDTEYDLSKYYIDNINTFTIGTKAMCYLGNDDKIIYINEITEDEMTYAYIVDIRKNDGLEKDIFIKIFSQSGEMLTPALEEKLIFNGTSYKAHDVYTVIKAFIDARELKTGTDLNTEDGKSIIKYILNSNGKIGRIAFAESISNVSDLSDSRGVYDAPRIYLSANTVYRNGNFAPYVVTSSSSVIFKIPLSSATRGIDENYEIVDSSSFKNNSTYFVTSYDVTRGGFAPVILVSSDTVTTDESSSAVVERVFRTINEDGMVCYAAQLYMDEEYGIYYATEDGENDVKVLKPGDVIRPTINKNKEIKSVIKDFDYESKTIVTSDKDVYPTLSGIAAPPTPKSIGYLLGMVYSCDGANAILVPWGTDMSVDIHPADTIGTTIDISKTVFVKIHKNRDGSVNRAEVYKEKSADAVNSYLKAGDDADFIVSRRSRSVPSFNVVYVD